MCGCGPAARPLAAYVCSPPPMTMEVWCTTHAPHPLSSYSPPSSPPPASSPVWPLPDSCSCPPRLLFRPLSLRLLLLLLPPPLTPPSHPPNLTPFIPPHLNLTYILVYLCVLLRLFSPSTTSFSYPFFCSSSLPLCSLPLSFILRCLLFSPPLSTSPPPFLPGAPSLHLASLASSHVGAGMCVLVQLVALC